MATIAFIGLGNMGGPMAANLAQAGHDVNAFDLSGAALNQAVEAGCNAADSAQHAVRGMHRVACDAQHAMRGMRCVACDTWHAPCGMRCAAGALCDIRCVTCAVLRAP